MSYQCALKEHSPQAVLSIRTQTAVQNLPQVLGQGYTHIGQYLDELGEQPAGPPFAAYHNMDMENLDVELGFPVIKPLPGRAEIKAGEILTGPAATCIYTGPYNDMAPAYDELSQWVKDQGYETTGVVYEMYLNRPDQTSPAELQTQIIFPLKSA